MNTITPIAATLPDPEDSSSLSAWELAPGQLIKRVSDDLYLVHRDVIFETALDGEYIGRRFRSFLNDEVKA